MQIPYECYAKNARLNLEKIVESQGELDVVKKFMGGLNKEHDHFRHEMLFHIADEQVLSENKVPTEYCKNNS